MKRNAAESNASFTLKLVFAYKNIEDEQDENHGKQTACACTRVTSNTMVGIVMAKLAFGSPASFFSALSLLAGIAGIFYQESNCINV